MALQKGDKVLIREGLIPFDLYGGAMFLADMLPFVGKIVTVSEVAEHSLFKIEEDFNFFKYLFSEAMVAKIVKKANSEEPKEMTLAEIEKQLGYKIKIKENSNGI